MQLHLVSSSDPSHLLPCLLLQLHSIVQNLAVDYPTDWLPDPHNKQVVSPRNFLGFDARLSVLIDKDRHKWLNDTIDNTFLPHEASLIKAIPLCFNDYDDRIFWPLNVDGSYSVKSGYRLLSEEIRNTNPSVSNLAPTKRLWKGIWSLRVPNRVKTLLWQAGTDSLPSRANLMKRKVLCNDLCPDCKLESETTFHALWACRAVAQVCELKFAWLRKLSDKCSSFLDVIQICQDHGALLDLFAMLVSLLWTRRNQLRVGEPELKLKMINALASEKLCEFWTASGSSSLAPRAAVHVNWLPPPKDWMKVLSKFPPQSSLSLHLQISDPLVLAPISAASP
nr:putative ribonuclease h protein [Quercus suber]